MGNNFFLLIVVLFMFKQLGFRRVIIKHNKRSKIIIRKVQIDTAYSLTSLSFGVGTFIKRLLNFITGSK